MGAAWWLIVAAASIVPMLRLLPHFGINRYWALSCVLPLATIALLWIMAARLRELEKL